MSVVSLDPARRVLLKDQAYRSLREAIVSGALAPGQQLREEDLAERLGVSKAPVRDAIARLVADGLVESSPQRWTLVAPLVPSVVRDAVLVVRAMHELVAREAAGRLTPDDLARMTRANADFEAAVRSGDIDAALAADDAFHDVPVRVVANRAATETIERYTPLIRRLERLQFSPLPGQASVRLHRRLVAALRQGDAEAAVAVSTSIWSALERELAAATVTTPTPTTAPTTTTRRTAR